MYYVVMSFAYVESLWCMWGMLSQFSKQDLKRIELEEFQLHIVVMSKMFPVGIK
jgi:hypothetical protein